MIYPNYSAAEDGEEFSDLCIKIGYREKFYNTAKAVERVLQIVVLLRPSLAKNRGSEPDLDETYFAAIIEIG